jgi:hypothetical protein
MTYGYGYGASLAIDFNGLDFNGLVYLYRQATARRCISVLVLLPLLRVLNRQPCNHLFKR